MIHTRKPRLGIIGMGHYIYWPQFEGLREELMGKQNIRMVINRVNPKMIAAMGVTVDDIMDQCGLPLLGVVPEDEAVPLAAAFRKPLLEYGKKGAAAACKRIAKRIRGEYVPVKL